MKLERSSWSEVGAAVDAALTAVLLAGAFSGRGAPWAALVAFCFIVSYISARRIKKISVTELMTE